MNFLLYFILLRKYMKMKRFFSSRAFRPTRGIVIQKFVCASVRPCVRASVRMMSQTCNRHNLRTVIGMDLLFFLMGWYKQGVVQWQTKLGLRMGKALICNSFLHYLLCNICILGNIWTWKGNENQTNIIFTYLDTCHSFSTFSKKSTFYIK